MFEYAKREGRWQMIGDAFVADPVTAVLTDTRSGDHYAALNLGHFGTKLHRKTKGGAWHEIAVPKYPPIDGDEGPSLKQIWCLAAAGADQPGTIWAGTIPGGLFRSDDRGESWHLMTTLWNREERKAWMGGGYDEPGVHSICIHPDDSNRLLIAISCGGVWETRDGGETWSLEGKGLRAAFMPPERAFDPNIQDIHLAVRCQAHPDRLWGQHHNGIFYSRDGGANWTECEDVAPSSFGFAVAVHPRDPDKAWFVPGIKDERRIPPDARLVVTHTRDGGRSFETLSAGLPEEKAYDVVYRHALAIDDSGEILAFGSTTGNLWLSENGGARWQQLSGYLPPIYATSLDAAV